jgi:hypothetical protein
MRGRPKDEGAPPPPSSITLDEARALRDAIAQAIQDKENQT